MLQQILAALDLPLCTADRLRINGSGSLDSPYPVSDLACATVGGAALLLTEGMDLPQLPDVHLDRLQASWWFGYSLKPEGWTLPKVRSPMTGDYRAQDGWIRIHANAPHHRQRARAVLDLPEAASREETAARVRLWRAQALEDALVEQAACAAILRSPADWKDHPQGRAIAAEPLVHHTPGGKSGRPCAAWTNPRRPLEGVRVLDLTRVLAGPAATRFLAAYGADVLRLDPADWTEPGMVPEVTVGKHCAALDLREPEGRRQFQALLGQADVLIHGLRPGALDRLGFDTATRQALRPGLVDVCLSAWGWSGPWWMRRGFDSLVQMSTGIAWRDREPRPCPLPVQALDQATGYLMAACALRGLMGVRKQETGSCWRVSLARTAQLLTTAEKSPRSRSEPLIASAAPPGAYADEIETTAWGPAYRLRPPCTAGDALWSSDRGAVDLRSDPPKFCQ
ncbi:MAG TPA: CoA transferase [Castellaniella sp.]|uniref:CoA transferase n=1 Tax=Castellaniella sp. TaxID=1955812 RepID=UPI002EE70F44